MLTVQEVYYHKPASGGDWDQKNQIDCINDWEAVKKRWAERTARYERLGRGRARKEVKDESPE